MDGRRAAVGLGPLNFVSLINWVSGAVLAALMVLITLNALIRFLPNSGGIPGALEITEFLMPMAVFLGLAHAQREKSHVQVPLLKQRLPERQQIWLDIVIYLLGTAVLATCVWQSWIAAGNSLLSGEVSQGVLQIPMFPARYAVPIGSGLMALELLKDAIIQVRRLGGRA